MAIDPKEEINWLLTFRFRFLAGGAASVSGGGKASHIACMAHKDGFLSFISLLSRMKNE